MTEYIITTHNEPDAAGSYRLTKPAEEIVRCRDCANHTYTPKGSCRCDYWMTFVEPDGFCAWGELKERIES